jgi:hypothetical protein
VNIQQLRALPLSVQYLIYHGIVKADDKKQVDTAVQASNLPTTTNAGDLWRISTDRGLAS